MNAPWYVKLIVRFFPFERKLGPLKPNLEGWRTFLIAVSGTLGALSFIIQQVTAWAGALPPIPFPIEQIAASLGGAALLWSNYTASLPAREAVKVAGEAKIAAEAATTAALQTVPAQQVTAIVEQAVQKQAEMPVGPNPPHTKPAGSGRM